jgi:hypothetical protein
VEHLRQNGFRVKTRDVAALAASRNLLGMPESRVPAMPCYFLQAARRRFSIIINEGDQSCETL